MDQTVKMFIHAISGKIKDNLTEIYKNHKVLSDFILQAEYSEYTAELQKKYDSNKMLLLENQDLINMKLLLQNFCNKETEVRINGEETITARYTETPDSECHAMIIDGRFFNIQYPANSNNSFFLKMKIFINMLNLQSLN